MMTPMQMSGNGKIHRSLPAILWIDCQVFTEAWSILHRGLVIMLSFAKFLDGTAQTGLGVRGERNVE